MNNRINIIKESKFKNIRFSVNFYTPVTKENATFNQLLMKVLCSGCEDFPTLNHINRRLAELFGSKLSTRVKRVQNNLCMSVVFDSLCEKYSDKGIIADIMLFVRQLLTKPLIINGAFSKDIIDREKNILKNDIEALINDKRKYANMRCMEIACDGDEYGVNIQGYADILKDITPESLYNYFKYVTTSCCVKVFAVGNIDCANFEKEASELLDCFGKGEITKTNLLTVPETAKYVEEDAEVNQSKLSMAYTVGEAANGNEYTARVFDGLFGGTVVSKLFNNVREKLSLCYYASSAYIKQKGMLLVQSGVDLENVEKARTAIAEQLEDIKNGVFTDEELQNAASAVETSLLSVKDENAYLLDYYENTVGEDEMLAPEDVATRIIDAAVRENVIEFAKNIKLSAVFLLKGGEADE